MALGYDEADDPSIYIKFELKRDSLERTGLVRNLPQLKETPAYLLAWTTTPWTLPGNTALAVAPDAEYSIMESKDDYLIMASALVSRLALKAIVKCLG